MPARFLGNSLPKHSEGGQTGQIWPRAALEFLHSGRELTAVFQHQVFDRSAVIVAFFGFEHFVDFDATWRISINKFTSNIIVIPDHRFKRDGTKSTIGSNHSDCNSPSTRKSVTFSEKESCSPARLNSPIAMKMPPRLASSTGASVYPKSAPP
ncbi:MAG: hypothetical protein QG613_1801 [Pseudomonadota bacterium]|nr:hypothetical protein [Pseudomonadota bacterium]